ncbi:hypothetical protein ACFYYM_29460 [Streptomyces erythrochromogenes]|uniref:hypothetical protein n=1 Tax=Streptomyces erythrochromogenes TaxID=285574 RepID=UPI0036CF459A
MAVAQALGDWRRDALLLCLLPVFCWPAAVAAVLMRPEMLVVLLGPVVLGARGAPRRPPTVVLVLVLGEERRALTLGVNPCPSRSPCRGAPLLALTA